MSALHHACFYPYCHDIGGRLLEDAKGERAWACDKHAQEAFDKVFGVVEIIRDET